MARIKILGYAQKKGKVEDFAYDYVAIYGLGRLETKDTDGEYSQGSAGIDMRGTPETLKQLRAINFDGNPVWCEVEKDTFAKGKGASIEMVVSIVAEKPVLNKVS